MAGTDSLTSTASYTWLYRWRFEHDPFCLSITSFGKRDQVLEICLSLQLLQVAELYVLLLFLTYSKYKWLLLMSMAGTDSLATTASHSCLEAAYSWWWLEHGSFYPNTSEKGTYLKYYKQYVHLDIAHSRPSPLSTNKISKTCSSTIYSVGDIMLSKVPAPFSIRRLNVPNCLKKCNHKNLI